MSDANSNPPGQQDGMTALRQKDDGPLDKDFHQVRDLAEDAQGTQACLWGVRRGVGRVWGE